MSALELKIPPPVWLILSILAMVGVSRAVPGAALDLPAARTIGIGFILLGVAFDVPALIGFARARTTIWPTDPTKTSALVTTGIYRVTRNPMYLGMLLILVGAGWIIGNAAAFVMVGVFFLIITRFQILPEERALRARFGEDFDAYCQRTRRWI